MSWLSVNPFPTVLHQMLVEEGLPSIPTVRQVWEELAEVQRSGFSILWLALVGKIFRACLLYPMIIPNLSNTRYTKLVSHKKLGRFLPQDVDLVGGFLPMFWDMPRARLHSAGNVRAVAEFSPRTLHLWSGWGSTTCWTLPSQQLLQSVA